MYLYNLKSMLIFLIITLMFSGVVARSTFFRACEAKSYIIRCTHVGEQLVVWDAMYGKRDPEDNTKAEAFCYYLHTTDPECFRSVQTILGPMCNDKSRCKITPSMEVFENGCHYMNQYLEFYFDCYNSTPYDIDISSTNLPDLILIFSTSILLILMQVLIL